MDAHVGDHIVVHSKRAGSPDRHGVILEIRGDSGAPPYVVRWEGESTDHVIFPGSDAKIVHVAA